MEVLLVLPEFVPGMNAERSELVGRSPALTRGKFVACLIALSTISLPTILQWPGTHLKVILVSVLRRENSKVRIRVTRGWVESRSEVAEREACESDIIRYSRFELSPNIYEDGLEFRRLDGGGIAVPIRVYLFSD